MFRGINYDVGTQFGTFDTAPFQLSVAAIERDFMAIRDRLHCNAIQVYGSDPQRLYDTSALAGQMGFKVWIEPRLVDRSPQEHLQQIRDVAKLSQKLADRGNAIALTLGCELSVFMPGVIGGRTYRERIAQLPSFAGDFRALSQNLNEYLTDALAVARSEFTGAVTYAAAPWEAPDWSGFDAIGLDHYLMDLTKATYVETLRRHCDTRKPVLITEFGCCPYGGADRLGPAGYDIVDWNSVPPRIVPGIERDEQVQADYLSRLVRIFRQEGVHGAFAYTFSNIDMPHRHDARFDLDLASFGIVKTTRGVAGGAYGWEEKRAFGALAEQYSGDAPPR